MAAQQAADPDPEDASGLLGTSAVNGQNHIRAARASDSEGAFRLGVHVEHPASRDFRGVQGLGTLQADFLICRKDTFQGGVGDLAAVQNGQHHGDRDAVIAAQCGTVRRQPVTFHQGPDRIPGHVSITTGRCFTDHIHMALKDQGRRFLASGGGRREDDHIAPVIFDALVIVAGRKFDQEVADSLCIE